MNEIKGFVMSLIAAASVSALIDGFVSDGSTLKKYLKYIISLVLLLTLLSPLTKLLPSVPQFFDGISPDATAAMAKANSIVALYIEKAVEERFLCRAEATCEDGRLVVRIERKLGLLCEDVERYILQIRGLEAEVSYFE